MSKSFCSPNANKEKVHDTLKLSFDSNFECPSELLREVQPEMQMG